MALTFDGLNYVVKASAIVAAAPMTFACWFTPTSVAADAVLMAITSATSTHHSFFEILFQTSTKKVIAGISNDAGSTTDFTAVASTVMSAATTYHIVCVFASTTSRTIYVNGANSGTSSVSVSPGTCDNSYIGASKVNAALVAGAIGSIADPAIWNIALTATDAAALSAGIGPHSAYPTGLVGNPRLLGGDATEPDLVSATGWTPVLG